MLTYQRPLLLKYILPVYTAFLCMLSMLPASYAHAFGEENNTLYYLIELQRQYSRQCQGKPLAPVPPLLPSEDLRAIALEHATQNTPVETLLTAHNINYTSFRMLRTQEAPPKAAVDAMKTQNCEALLGGPYSMIGAEKAQGSWWVLLVEPAPAQAGQPAQPGQPTQSGPSSPSDQSGLPGLDNTPGAPIRTGEQTTLQAAPPLGNNTETSAVSAPPPLPIAGTVTGPVSSQTSSMANSPTGSAANAQPPISPGTPVVSQGITTYREDYSVPGSSRAQSYDPNAVPLDPQNVPVSPPEFVAQPGEQGALDLIVRPNGLNTPAATAPAAPSMPNQASQTTALPSTMPAPTAVTPSTAPLGIQPAQPAQVAQTPTPAPQGGTQFIQSNKSPAPVTAPTASLNISEASMLAAINNLRQQGLTCGNSALNQAPALKPNALLMQDAQKHVADLHVRKYLSTATKEGQTSGQRLKDLGYLWQNLATLLAQGHNQTQDALDTWLVKPNNCQSLLNKDLTDIGIGYQEEGRIWMVILATPMPHEPDAIYIYKE